MEEVFDHVRKLAFTDTNSSDKRIELTTVPTWYLGTRFSFSPPRNALGSRPGISSKLRLLLTVFLVIFSYINYYHIPTPRAKCFSVPYSYACDILTVRLAIASPRTRFVTMRTTTIIRVGGRSYRKL